MGCRQLIYIDITREGDYGYKRKDIGCIDNENINTIEDIIFAVSKKCFMPFTFGGGIRSMEDAEKDLVGADKITINKQAIEKKNFITELANEFGSQAIVVSVDAKKNNNGELRVFKSYGQIETDLKPHEWAKECQEKGAGEILINSIDRDGTANGYDRDLISSVVNSTTIPVIACGGVGSYSDFSVAIDCGASAAAAGNIAILRSFLTLSLKTLEKKGLNFR